MGVLALGGALAASAQTEPPLAPRTGTLRKLQDSGVVTLGHRSDAVPFAFTTGAAEPMGYSIDLCRLIVEALADELGRTLAVRWQPVSAASRIDAVASGQVDLECGSTTSNAERRQRVAFSPVVFVSGTRLLVRQGSGLRSLRDLAGRTVAVSAGTTNEKVLRELLARQKLDTAVRAVADLPAALALLASGQVQALAADEVLLVGLLAQQRLRHDYSVVGDVLSHEPYALMFRKDDPALADLVARTLARLAADGEIERRYRRWFLRPLPSGVSLDLPMGPELTVLLSALAGRPQ